MNFRRASNSGFRRAAVRRTVAMAILVVAMGLRALGAAESREREFRLPAGDAAITLREFARQSGEQIIYLVDSVRGARTNAVEGTMPSFDALQQLLAGTGFTAQRDATGAMAVGRPPETPLSRFDATTRRPPPPEPEDEIVRMTSFTVSSFAIERYRAADAVSAVRVRAGLLDTPSSLSVVTREVINDLVPTRIFDITRYVAGVEEGRGIQFSDRQIIRGFESNGRTVDNFLQSGADNFDEALIDRIEVSKGPNAILAPAGVPGGSINVITKSPRFHERRSLTALAGRFDAQKVTLDLTGPIGGRTDLAYRLVGAVQDSRRYWAEDTRLRGKVLAPMLTWQASPRTQLTVKLIAAEHWIFREPGLILDSGVNDAASTPRLAPGFSYRSRNGIQPWSHVGTHTADAFVLLTSNLDDHVSARFAANGRHYYEDSTQEFFSTPTLNNRYEPTTGRLTPDLIWAPDAATGAYVPTNSPFFDPAAIPVRGDTQRTTINTLNVQGDIAIVRHFSAVDTQTIAGLAFTQFRHVGRNRTGALPPIDLRRTDLRAEPVWSPDLYLDLRNRQSTRQAYLNQRVSFFERRLQFTVGGLHYAVDANSRNQVNTDAAPSVLHDSRALGLASVLIKPRSNLSLYYTRSTNSTPVIANDLPLWRDGRQDEIGFKSEFFRQRLSFNIASFRITQSNVSVPNPDHQTDPNAPEMLISDLGDRGLELELMGGLTPNLSIIASLTRLHLRDSLGRRVRAVADRNAALLLNYRVPLGAQRRLSLFAGINHAGERPGDATAVNFTPLNVPTRQSFKIAAYDSTTAGIAYKAGAATVRLNVDNVFNRHDYLQQAGGRVSGTGLSTAAGINVKVSTAVEF